MPMLSRLRLQRFRNYATLDVAFAPGLNVLVGSNGQGKTNVLEAVCYLALLRSFRTHRASSLKQWQTDGFRIEGTIAGDDPLESLALEVVQGERRSLRCNGIPTDKASDFINRFLCVPFVPEDIRLVRGPAGGRRRFADILLCQLFPGYLRELQGFGESLKARNIMLREPRKYPEKARAAYEDLLVRYGVAVERRRHAICRELGGELKDMTPMLFRGDNRRLQLRMTSFLSVADAEAEDTAENAYRRALDEAREKDAREGYTTTGPHRSDMRLALGGRSLHEYGSEGECRMASLALRLASLRLVRRSAGTERAVVLLVDDVSGELDDRRRESFHEVISERDQILLTTTHLAADLRAKARAIFTVESGMVTGS